MTFQQVFDQDAERERQNASGRKAIPLSEYLDLLTDDPKIAQNSPARLHEMILRRGVIDIPVHEQWLGASKGFPLFSDILFGAEKPVSDFMDYLGTGAARLSTGKQPVVLVGPPASGKSTIVAIIKRELELYEERPITSCPTSSPTS